MYITNLIAMNKRIMNKCANNKIYNIMNNMKYSKYIKNLNPDEFSLENNLEYENKVFTDGAYIFFDEYGIQAIYDYVNQTLFTNNKDLIKD